MASFSTRVNSEAKVKVSINRCFLCCGEVVKNSRDIIDPQDISFILTHILEVPQLDNFLERIKSHSRQISYCSVCSTKIKKVQNVLEDLEKLEKVLLDDKYQIELQFRKNSCNFSPEPVDEIRNDIVTDLRSSAIFSIVDKLGKKQIGRRRDPIRKSIRIMKGVSFPRDLPTTPPSTTNISELDVHEESIRIRSQRGIGQVDLTEGQVPPSTTVKNQNLNVSSKSASTSFEICSAYPSVTNISQNDKSDPLSMDFEIPEEKSNIGKTVSTSIEIDDMFFPEIIIVDDKIKPEDIVRVDDSYDLDSEPQVIDPLLVDEYNMETTEQEYQHPVTYDADPGNTFMCGKCGLAFENYILLNEHYKIHTESFKVRPPQSGSQQPSRNKKNCGGSPSKPKQGALPIVIPLTVPVSPDLRVECTECGKTFASDVNLRNHWRYTHLEQFNFRCHVCNLGLRCQSEFRNHMLTHSNLRKYKCHLCESSFKQKNNLTQHLKAHDA